jgi:HEAT repeat protein
MTDDTSPEIDKLFEDLNSDDWDVCRAAAEELGKIGDKSAVDPLIKMIEQTHVVVLKATIGVGTSEIAAYPAEAVDTAITALGEIGDVRAAKSLIKILEDSKETKWHSKTGHEVDKWEPLLGSKKAKTFKELFEQIGHYERKVYAESLRLHSAEALGHIGDACAVKPLIKALEDENEYVRAYAAWALGEIGDARAVGSLVELLEDDTRLLPGEDSVQSHAAQALGLIGDARAVDPLIKALGPEPLDDQNGLFRFQCSTALIKFGSAAVAPLIKALGKQSEAVYEAAVEALAHIGAVAVDPLIEALDVRHPIPEQFVMKAIWTGDKKLDVRRGAARALVIIGDKRAAPSLEKAGFKVLAMWILRDVSGLITALEDNNVQVRIFSAGALGKIGNTSAVKPLKKALNDKDHKVRKMAKESLKKLGHEVE